MPSEVDPVALQSCVRQQTYLAEHIRARGSAPLLTLDRPLRKGYGRILLRPGLWVHQCIAGRAAQWLFGKEDRMPGTLHYGLLAVLPAVAMVAQVMLASPAGAA